MSDTFDYQAGGMFGGGRLRTTSSPATTWTSTVLRDLGEVTPDKRGRVAIGRHLPPGTKRVRVFLRTDGSIVVEPLPS